MADRSLIYFLFFIFLWLTYTLYQQEVENERLFQLAVDQRDEIADQNKLINAQTIYIKMLENELTNSYDKGRNNPLHGKPL